VDVVQAESGWYHGAVEASVPGLRDGGFFILRLLKMPSCGLAGEAL
jgi:hypothetical protein